MFPRAPLEVPRAGAFCVLLGLTLSACQPMPPSSGKMPPRSEMGEPPSDGLDAAAEPDARPAESDGGGPVGAGPPVTGALDAAAPPDGPPPDARMVVPLFDAPCTSAPLARGLLPLVQSIIGVMNARAGAGSQALALPSTADRDRFGAAVVSALGGQPDAGCRLPSSYRVVLLHAAGGDVVVAAELDATGAPAPTLFWGTYAALVAPTTAPSRDLAVEAPHPLFDFNTWREATDLFLQGRARWLLITGAHRCADAAASACTGMTAACGALGPFKVSDAAHSAATPFFGVHAALSKQSATLQFLQLHGERSAGCPGALVSDASRTWPAAGVAVTLASELQTAGLTVGRCYAAAPVAFPSATCNLCGDTNVEGRFTEGSTDACRRSGPGASRMVLLEQDPTLVATPVAGVGGYKRTIDAVLMAYPAH